MNIDKNLEEYELFKKEYWNKFLRLRESHKKELINYWFKRFKDTLKENYWIDENLNLYSDQFFYFNKTKEEYLLYIEYRSFTNEYSYRFSRLNKDRINELLKYWFNNFQKMLKEKNWIRNDWNLYDRMFIYFDKWEKEYIDDTNKILFLNKYKQRFYNLWEKNKQELINFWFDNFQKILKEKNWIKDEWNLYNNVFLLFDKNEKDFLQDNEYELFKKEYWNMFIKQKTDKKEKLIEYWFRNFQETLKEKDWIKVKWNLYYNIFFYFDKSREEYFLDIEYDLFSEEYWRKFESIWRKWKKELLNYWFDNFQKTLKEKYWIRIEWSLYKDVFLNFNKTKDEYLYLKEYKLFSNEYWSWFGSMNKERKNEIVNYWFENFKRSLTEKHWIKIEWNLFDDIFIFLDKTKEEYYYHVEQKKFIEKYWLSFSLSISKNEIIEYWYGEFVSFMSEHELNKYDNRKIFNLFFLKTLWKIEFDKCWNVVCNKCWNKEKIDELSLSRIYKKQEVCTKCFPLKWISFLEKDLVSLIRSFYDWEIIENSKTILKSKKEIDIYLPELKLWFEFNWVYWHSSDFDNWKTYEKYKECLEQWIKLIVIWEDQWVNKSDIIEHRIRNLLWKSKKIYARDCIIKEIDSYIKNDFLEEYHLMWKDNSTIKLWAYYWDELVWVMTFSKPSKAKWWWDFDYELNRFATKYNVVWLWSKFMKYMCDNHEFEIIKSFSDNQWWNWDVYLKMWFEYAWETKMNYYYVNKMMNRNKLNKYDNSNSYNLIVSDLWSWIFIFKKNQ